MNLPTKYGANDSRNGASAAERNEVTCKMEKQKEYNQCGKTCACGDCPQDGMCRAWAAFVEKHDKCKGYAHFDRRVSLGMEQVRSYVTDADKIAAHGFYPFIHFERKNPRYGRKGPKKPRELYYCSHMDRCVYQRYAFLINYYYNIRAREEGIDQAAIAYRDNLGKDNIAFAKEVFDAIRGLNRCLVIVGDFTDFFDKLDHDYLKQRLCEVLCVEWLPEDYFAVFKNITRFASWDWEDIVRAAGEDIDQRGIQKKLNQKRTVLSRPQFLENTGCIRKNTSGVGIPQGSPISAVLANVYMLRFDKTIQEYAADKGGIYRRYSDDFIIAIPITAEDEAKEHIDYVFHYIDTLGGLVELQREKTSLYLFENDSVRAYPSGESGIIDYLGFWFDGRNIRIRPRSITKYYYRMRRKARTIGRSHWQSPTGKRITARNLYQIYSHSETKQTFIDYAKKATRVLGLRDPEASAVIKKHKQKIAQAIKKARNSGENGDRGKQGQK